MRAFWLLGHPDGGSFLGEEDVLLGDFEDASVFTRCTGAAVLDPAPRCGGDQVPQGASRCPGTEPLLGSSRCQTGVILDAMNRCDASVLTQVPRREEC